MFIVKCLLVLDICLIQRWREQADQNEMQNQSFNWKASLHVLQSFCICPLLACSFLVFYLLFFSSLHFFPCRQKTLNKRKEPLPLLSYHNIKLYIIYYIPSCLCRRGRETEREKEGRERDREFLLGHFFSDHKARLLDKVKRNHTNSMKILLIYQKW